MRRLAVVATLFLALAAPSAGAAGAASRRDRLPLTRVADIALPGRPTRFDYEAVDPVARRLYIAHLGDSTLDVIDLDTLRVVATVPNISQVHGVAVAPNTGRIYATATGVNQLATIDAATNKVIAHTATASFPDGVAYDERDGLIFVSNKDDGSLTVVDATTNTVTRTIKLGDETGNVVYDQTSATVYAAVRTPDVLAVIDPTTGDITRRIGLQGCDGAHGVYLDTGARRAFVACERNAQLVAVDLRTNREIAKAAVGSKPDVLAFDVGLQRLYVASESGSVTVFDSSHAALRKLGQAHLADAAHSVAVDQATHRAYFPLENVRGAPVLRVMAPTRLG